MKLYEEKGFVKLKRKGKARAKPNKKQMKYPKKQTRAKQEKG